MSKYPLGALLIVGLEKIDDIDTMKLFEDEEKEKAKNWVKEKPQFRRLERMPMHKFVLKLNEEREKREQLRKSRETNNQQLSSTESRDIQRPES